MRRRSFLQLASGRTLCSYDGLMFAASVMLTEGLWCLRANAAGRQTGITSAGQRHFETLWSHGPAGHD